MQIAHLPGVGNGKRMGEMGRRRSLAVVVEVQDRGCYLTRVGELF